MIHNAWKTKTNLAEPPSWEIVVCLSSQCKHSKTSKHPCHWTDALSNWGSTDSEEYHHKGLANQHPFFYLSTSKFVKFSYLFGLIQRFLPKNTNGDTESHASFFSLFPVSTYNKRPMAVFFEKDAFGMILQRKKVQKKSPRSFFCCAHKL